MSIIDYDELQCPNCGHIGLLPNGDFDAECPECETEVDLSKDY